MSFSVLRAPLRTATATPFRRAATAQAPNFNRVLLRTTFNRKYSTPPPPPPQAKSGTGLYVGVGAAVVLGLTYYYYDTVSSKEAGTAVKSGVQAAKAFVPSTADYIKVDQKGYSFPFRLPLISCVLGCRYTTKLPTSLTKRANMMVHSIVIRVLSKPPSLHDVNL
jgi:hypothetical protein